MREMVEQGPKFFSVEEANRTLPLVRRIVEDIVSTHRELVETVEEYRSLEGEGESERRRRGQDEIEELTATVNRYVAELSDLGVLFKGFEDGLVDFYTIMEDRPVFLCWKLGEDHVAWWHELDAGYAGRQRLPAKVSEGGGS